MDFLDPAKKRAHKIRLHVGYFLIAIIIALGTLILVFQSYGYNLDRKTGEIIQNGLLFVGVQPVEADVFLNGDFRGRQGSARMVLPADTYKLELMRDGYRTWQKTFSLAGGSIERLVYPFLFPENLDTQDLQLYARAPVFATQSPDRRWLLVQTSHENPSFDLYDLSSPQRPPLELAVPTRVLSASNEYRFETEEWSTDNQHVLLKQRMAGGNEFIMLDIEEPSESVNVSRVFGSRDITSVQMQDREFDSLYLYSSQTNRLELGDLRDGSVSPVLNNVLAYKTHDDNMVVYVTDRDTPRGEVSVRVRDSSGTYELRKIPRDERYLLDVARFNNRWHILAGAPVQNHVYVYKDPVRVLRGESPSELRPVGLLRVDDPSNVSFSANARFMVANSGSNFAVYDTETGRNYRYDIDVAVDDDDLTGWMDGHRLYVMSNGKTVVFDYDGTNLQKLTSSAAGFTPYFDREYDALYNVAPSIAVQNRFALTATNLEVQED